MRGIPVTTMLLEFVLLMSIGLWPLLLVIGAGIARQILGVRRPAIAQ
jgi:hypothetical protein